MPDKDLGKEAHEAADVEATSNDGLSDSDDDDVGDPGGVDAAVALRQMESHDRRIHGRRRSRSRLSTDSDPYEALERALTSPDQETQAEHAARQMLALTRTATTVGSTMSRMLEYEVAFEPDDREDPKCWPVWYRAWVIVAVSYSCWVVVLYSTSYTATIPGLMKEYNEPSETVATLGITTYLLGLAAGALIVAPMSELYGRRPVYLICLVIFVLLIIPSALATSLTEILLVRFFGALFGSAMVSNGPGTVVDIASEEYLALCMSLFSVAPLNGPVSGPIVGGFVFEYLGWRWNSWLAMILGAVAFTCVALTKETYAPAILRRRAVARRKESDDERWWSRYDEKISTFDLLKINLSRPFVLSFTEPILWFFNIWISVCYGVLYLCFVAYPIVFSQYRGWGPGISGLSFIGIGIGTIFSIVCEPLWRRIINSHEKDPETGRVPPEATAAIMTIGAVLTAVGQLVFSWTCLPVTIHWAIPIAFGIPFGAGNTLCFIYGSNYLAGAYGIYAASALAGNTVMRSIFGATLPLAGPNMYRTLTPRWAGTLLGLLEVCLIPIPFAFYRYGARIRARSRLIRQMREDQEQSEARRARLARRSERRAAACADGDRGTQEGQGSEKSNGVAHRSNVMQDAEAGRVKCG
ncbi:hypothetical protein VTK73DRAFT_10114 [Phialemonium thermophilum]|uniref:Major facilitator superfamily (MFS) profile domain-containing protein n=1 Tax=Phialemonium thermophilum TaxID=223376 RepID=A0ABR3XHS7_9PEZI